jgi:tetratricopeptide (TPR) repeat protein
MALQQSGRLGEAAAAYDEAIAALRRLVQGEGRTELANVLAAALLNKGMALDDLGRLGEAAAAYDEAIAALRRLVQDEGRTELADDLAKALMNKANALRASEPGQPSDVQLLYDEAISLWQNLIVAGATHLVSVLVKAFGIRFGFLLEQTDWQAAAADLEQAFGVAFSSHPGGDFPFPLQLELGSWIVTVRDLPADQREQVEAHLPAELVEWLRRQTS